MTDADKRLEEIRAELRRIGLLRGAKFAEESQVIWDSAQDLLDIVDTLRTDTKAAWWKTMEQACRRICWICNDGGIAECCKESEEWNHDGRRCDAYQIRDLMREGQ